MLAERYTEEHNITTLRVFDRYARGIGSRNLVSKLQKMGILEPYSRDGKDVVNNLWRVNIKQVFRILEDLKGEKDFYSTVRDSDQSSK